MNTIKKINGVGWALVLMVTSLVLLSVICYDFIVQNRKDIGVNAIGAYLGFVGAAVIFLIQIDNDNSKSKRETLEKHKEHLRYFAGVIDDVVNYAKGQAQSMSELREAIASQPSVIHQLAFVASDAIGRLNKADSEAAFHAYNTLLVNNPDREKSYRIILAKTDFLSAQLVAVKQAFLDYRDGLYKRQLKLKDIIQAIADDAAFLLNELQQPEPTFTFTKYAAPGARDELNNIILSYIELNSRLVPFEDYFQVFVEPLKAWLHTNKDFFPLKHSSYQRRENLVRLAKGASVALTDLVSNARDFMPAFNPDRLLTPAEEMEVIVRSLKSASNI